MIVKYFWMKNHIGVLAMYRVRVLLGVITFEVAKYSKLQETEIKGWKYFLSQKEN